MEKCIGSRAYDVVKIADPKADFLAITKFGGYYITGALHQIDVDKDVILEEIHRMMEENLIEVRDIEVVENRIKETFEELKHYEPETEVPQREGNIQGHSL